MTIDAKLPGADLVEAGLRDLARGALTVEALLVLVGRPRLSAAGIPVPAVAPLSEAAELALYRKVADKHPQEAHARYNGLIQRLVSFENCFELQSRPQRARGTETSS